jgi:hypothetical protein
MALRLVTRAVDRPSKASVSAVTKTLRDVLTSLAGRQALSDDDLETLFEKVDAQLATLPKQSWVFDVLERVVGKSARRKADAPFVLVTLAGAPGAEARLLRFLEDPSARVRLEIIGAIHRQRWLHLAPVLAARLAVEDDASCRNALIAACGDLRVTETFDALLATAKRDLERPCAERVRLLFNLRKHADKRARAYFKAVFELPLTDPAPHFDGAKEVKVLAAWGLLSLGAAPKAHAFLVAMLDDVRIVHIREGQITGVEPGLSERAGQALADLHGLAFRWGKGDLPKVRAHVRRLRSTT